MRKCAMLASKSGLKKQKGASSLEYVMLAAVIVAILIVVSQTELGTTMSNFFVNLFETATDTSGMESSGG